MNTLWNKFLCAILSLALLINLLPVSALALETSAEQPAVQHWVEDPPVAATEKTTQPLEIVSEDISKRTEFYKEFVLSNGLRMASLYAEPVHYADGGQWKEIDNTLKLADGAYTNTAGQWKVSFPQQLTKDKAVSITKDGYTLSFYMAGALYRDSTSLLRTVLGSAEQEPIQLQSFQAATAQLHALDKPVIQEETLYPQAPADKTHARLQYADVSTGTDIVYDLKGNQVKESIILDAYNAKLQGYRYTLNVGKLNPVLTDSGEIQLYDRDNKQIVMVMPAPFLVDNAGEYCYDVELTLNGTGSQYTLTYQLPQQWLADSARQWPVVLDPVVNANDIRTNIRDVSVYERNGTSNNNKDFLDIGYDPDYGKMRAYLKYAQLPELTSADVIVKAQLSLLKVYDSTMINPIEVRKVLENWESETTNWANKPDIADSTEDYVIAQNAGTYHWDITDIVRGWYDGENTGLVLKASDWVETSNSSKSYWKQFFSSDYSEATRPLLTIVFRNSNGLESYWDYTSTSAGRAGTGYINDCAGNLVWVHNDIGYGGNLMPVSINHVYNANDAATNDFGLGYGWRTNYHQTLSRFTVENGDAVETYYAWEDSDGTIHCFYKNDKNVYTDEDGMELTLTLASGTLSDRITDKEGNTYHFDSQGRLYKLENNQETPSSINIAYTTGKLISTITDGVGRKYQFTYSNNLLTKITYTGIGVSQVGYVEYMYSNSCPVKITYQDGKYSQFTYSSKRLLTSAQDIDGYKLSYTYTTGSPSRIKTVTETHNGKTGSTLTLEYTHNQTTLTETAVSEGKTKTLGVQIKQFNNWGNTTSVRDNEGRTQFANYASNDQTDSGKANQLLVASKLQTTVVNMIKDSSFEHGTPWNTVNGISRSFTTDESYIGYMSMKLTNNLSTTFSGIVSDTFIAEPGKTYTFSAYMKTAASSRAYLSLGPASTAAVSETLAAGQNWTRLQVSYTNNTSENVNMNARILCEGGSTAYVDCVQLEIAETASRYNLIDNGDFSYGIYEWIKNSDCNSGEQVVISHDITAPLLDNHVLMMCAAPEEALCIRQTIYIRGVADDTFVLAGWARGNTVPLTSDDRSFSIRGRFCYTDQSTADSEFTFDFNPDTSSWQCISGAMVAKKAYSSIQVDLLYECNANEAFFDGIQLYKEEFGNSYTYDDDGNVISVKDLQGQITQYEYENNDLTQMILPTGAELTYTYDDHHNVETASTQEGVDYAFTYDEYGNNLSVSITSSTGTIASTAAYSDDHNRLVSTTDARGKTTTYSYNANTNVLEWVQYPNDTPDTRTEYTYDQMYRVAQAALTTDSGLNLSAQYNYTNDLLTSIETPSTTYNFAYGNFGLRSSVKIGTQELAGYSYESGTNRLKKLDYGNGDHVQYTYDDQGRVTQQKYEDNSYVTYKYDNSGALATVYDSLSGITTTYYYDFTDRMMKYVEKGSGITHSVGYTYDNINNLTKMVETIGTVVRTTSYTYDGDNRVKSVTSGSASESYTYDTLGRVSGQTTNHNNQAVVSQAVTYIGASSGAPTAMPFQLIYDGTNYDTTFAYGYSPSGNIAYTNNDNNIVHYRYDTANQLIRENHAQAGTTTLWTYDNAGNILKREVYAYTNGTPKPENKISEAVYTYGDSQWGDLLTAYKGTTITYDGVGNPLNDGTWSYTWQHGRQLAAMEKASGIVITTQPEDAICEIGGSCTFTVTAEGRDLTYQWQYSYNGGGDWANEADDSAQTPTFVIDSLASNQTSYRWRCVITDANGNQTISQRVERRSATASSAVIVTDQPDSCYCAVGDAVSFTVAATGNNLTYQWKYSTDGGSTWSNVSGSIGGTTPTVTIHAVSDRDFGYQWYCNIKDSSGNVVTTRRATILSENTRWANYYNVDGMRIRRTDGISNYRYTYLGNQLTQMTVDGEILNFTYNASGSPMSVTYDSNYYYYVTNLQGDVISILNSTGAEVVRYTYDAWGNLHSATGDLATTLGFYNPLRYRGYVYDPETKLYYLQSRYYNPEMGRFINGDGLVSTGQGLLGNNMFTYCNNNPVTCRDSAGRWTQGISVGASVYLGFGASVSIGYFWDDDGNGEFQWSYCVPGVNDTAAMGVCAIGAGITYQWTNYDTVSDLYGLGSTLGGSAGPSIYGSIESVLEGSISERENVSHGIQIGIGYGAGAEVHVANTQTSKVGKKNKTTSIRGSAFAYPFPDPYFQQYTSNAPAHVSSVFCRCLLCKNDLI